MRNNFFPKTYLQNFKFLFLVTILLISGCNSDDDANTPDSLTITVGVFLLNGSTYTDTNKDLIFTTSNACQTWIRTALSDTHSSVSHNHFNAAKDVTYNTTTATITWVEFGPEITQEAIDITCAAGLDGALKTANSNEYSPDKNFFLQIKSIE